MRLKIRQFLPLGLAITLICALVYVVTHQTLRLSANDPQTQILADVIGALESGRDPKQVIPPVKVDIDKSLAIFGTVFDDSGNIVISSVQLDGKTPELPKGVLDYVRKHGQSSITWQPKAGVRSAVVVRKYGGDKPGFALIGRSIREIDARQKILLKQVVIGWLVILAVTFSATIIFTTDKKRRK